VCAEGVRCFDEESEEVVCCGMKQNTNDGGFCAARRQVAKSHSGFTSDGLSKASKVKPCILKAHVRCRKERGTYL
jgi:hypothetical protein